jgi:hypothetical protein
MDEEQERSNFWSTVPGIMTGMAALISAATGGYLAFSRVPATAPAAASASQAAPPAELKPAAVPTASPAAQPSGATAPAALVDADAPATPSPAPPRPIVTGEPRPSFNCALASTAVETMLCSDADLADRDRRAARLYFALRGTLPPSLKSQLLQSKKWFLDQRSDCATSECLSDLYDVRLRQLAEFDSNRNR